MKPFPEMNSSNTALFVIDIVNGCVNQKCEKLKLNIRFSKIREMVPNLINFIEEYRKIIGGLVIFTKTPPWKKEFLPENINTLYSDPSTSYYSEDNSGFSEKFYLVKPNPKDVIINKNNYDAFSETDLNRILKEKGVKYIVVTGVFTDGCVLATIIAGFSLGYNFVILKDLIETTDSKIRQELQEKLKEFTFPIMYGRTLISSDFIENWNL